MNRTFLKLAMIAMLVIIASVNVNAQWFMEGEVGVNVHSGNRKDVQYDINDASYFRDYTIDETSIGFKIAPKGGYYFNEKFALGLSLSVGGTFSESLEKYKYPDINLNQEVKSRKNSVDWGIYPFVRYSVFTYRKFSVLLREYTGVGCSHGFGKINDGKFNDGKITSTTISIAVFNVTPILSFKFNDHLQMEAGLGFLNVGYNINISKAKFEGSGGLPNYPYKLNDTKHDFNIGFNSSSVLALSQLTIGVVYKF